MSVFIGYAMKLGYQMMKGKKGNNDGFPSKPLQRRLYQSI